MTKENLSKLVRKALNECGDDISYDFECQGAETIQKEPFYTLAPDVVGSINNFKIYPDKNLAAIGFGTNDGGKFNLIVPSETMYAWMDKEGDDKPVSDFVKMFLSFSKPTDETEGSEMLGEIVDEDGNLIGDEDRPPNANFKQIGGSKLGSDNVMKMIVPKSKRYYGDMGLGFITW